jgi:hypothetical protein
MAATSTSSDESDSETTDFTLIYKAAKFLKKDLDGLISRFVERHASTFEGDAENDVEHKEHSLEDTLLHREFVEQFEEMLERYIEDECPKMSKQAALQLFFDGARDTMEGRFQPLFFEEEDPKRDFVESLLAVDDFQHFFKMLASASVRSNVIHSSSEGGKTDEEAGRKRK